MDCNVELRSELENALHEQRQWVTLKPFCRSSKRRRGLDASPGRTRVAKTLFGDVKDSERRVETAFDAGGLGSAL